MCSSLSETKETSLRSGPRALVLDPQAVNQVALEPEDAGGMQNLLLGVG